MAFQWHQICLQTFPLDSDFGEGNTLGLTGCVQHHLKSSRRLFIFHSVAGVFPAKSFFKIWKNNSRNYFSKRLKESCCCHTYQLEVFFLLPISMELSFSRGKNPMNNLVLKNYENCFVICVAFRRKANFAWQIEKCEEWCNEKVHRLPETRWKHRKLRQQHVNGDAAGKTEFSHRAKHNLKRFSFALRQFTGKIRSRGFGDKKNMKEREKNETQLVCDELNGFLFNHRIVKGKTRIRRRR